MLKSKGFKISLISVLSVVMVAVLSYVFAIKIDINLNGESELTVEANSDYIDAGAEINFSVFGIKTPLDFSCENNVDTTSIGEYGVIYSAKKFGKIKRAERKVIVDDNTPPEIIVSAQTVKVSLSLEPVTADKINFEFSAIDSFDGDVSAGVTKEVDGDTLRLIATDSVGNQNITEIKIEYVDDKPPVISLGGSSLVYVKSGTEYSEIGYSANDNIDGDLTSKVKITGLPDMSKSGIYVVTYSVTDSAGNTTYATRKVAVYGAGYADAYKTVEPNGKTVYLTFDDGPGPYTAELLDILSAYNVKATFFVTNQFPKYQHLIGRAYSEGHAIGVHTYTHKWNVYSSLESYVDDFTNMHNLIKEQTGIDTKIFRFPGGANNTVSKSYARGVVSAIATHLTSQGYVYYDWNCDCNDASNASTSQIIQNVTRQIENKNYSIVLMHDIKKKTVNAVPAIIEYCLAHGYNLDVITTETPLVQLPIAN